MRTTVTLDEDLAVTLRETARNRGVPFKKVLNDALRAGLKGKTRAQKFTMPTRELGVRPEIDLNRALQLADRLEDQEIRRKLELRK